LGVADGPDWAGRMASSYYKVSYNQTMHIEVCHCEDCC